MPNLFFISFLIFGLNPVETNQQNLDAFFKDINKLEIRIAYHGGYELKAMGVGYLFIKAKNKGKFKINYIDYLGDTYNCTIKKSKLDKLKEILSDFIEIHEPDKKLKGTCSIPDKNLMILDKNKSMKIKPKTNVHRLHIALDVWLEDNITK